MATAIEFSNVSKQYRLGIVSTKTLGSDLHRWWTVNVCRKEDPYLKVGSVNDRTRAADSDFVWALRDIDFSVEQGDVVGIIGKNGAGKSTLLKLLGRITSPTTGTIKANGRIGSLLEVGTGFHPEMTGRENIFLNGAILGMKKNEISKKLDEIIDFSGCERYIDTPVKRYSSGMTVRLGFAVASHLDPEILVVDEVLAVGDVDFQRKAIGKMKNISRSEGRTVLFVSHNMASIRSLCKNGILLKNGTIEYTGEINDVVDHYIAAYGHTNVSFCTISDKNRDGYVSKDLEIIEACIENDVNQIASDETLQFNLKVKRNNQRIKDFTVGLHIINEVDSCVGTSVSSILHFDNGDYFSVHIVVPSHNLSKGHYSVHFNIGLKLLAAGLKDYDVVKNVISFDVVYVRVATKEPFAIWQSGWGSHCLNDVGYSIEEYQY